MEFINVDYGANQYLYNSYSMIINIVAILYFLFISKYSAIFLSKNKGDDSAKSNTLVMAKDIMSNSSSSNQRSTSTK